MAEPSANEASAHAISSATDAAEAIERARIAQQNELLEKQRVMMQEAVIAALNRGAVDKKYIDIGRIPFICDDVRGIHNEIKELREIIQPIAKAFTDAGGFKKVGMAIATTVVVFLSAAWLGIQIYFKVK